MSYDYSENILVQESAGHLLEDELGWRVELAYNTEVLGETGTFGRKSYKEILLVKYLKEALLKLNPWLTPALLEDAIKTFESHMSSASLMQINEERIQDSNYLLFITTIAISSIEIIFMFKIIHYFLYLHFTTH